MTEIRKSGPAGEAGEAALEFKAFAKIPRLFRACTITEKIDGTNAQVFIYELPDNEFILKNIPIATVYGKWLIYAGSRNRWITPKNDNYGFAGWVEANAQELIKLGPGNHYGEWWGSGIQRRYGLTEKRFSLFNISHWIDVYGTNERTSEKQETAPSCCHVVPILDNTHYFDSALALDCIAQLRTFGSRAAPGFMQPEGIVIYHERAQQLFKVTCEKDSEFKGKSLNE